MIAGSVTSAAACDDEAGDEAHHQHAAVLRQHLDDVVGDVARDLAQRARVGMRKDHRRLRDAQRIAHGVGRGVRQVHEHADAVHLVHDLLAERRSARRGPGESSTAESAQLVCLLWVSVM